MRRLCLLFVALFVAVMLSNQMLYAQVGIKGGVNISTPNQTGTDILSLKWETIAGLIIGGYYRFEINEYFSIQPELYYSRKGGKLEEGIGGVLVKKTLKIDYLELPLLAKFTIPTEGNLKPSFFAGAYGAIKLSDQGKTEAFGLGIEEGLIDVKGSDFGLVFGLGLDFSINGGVFLLDLRYSLGLTNISEQAVLVSDELKNRVFSIMLGFGI